MNINFANIASPVKFIDTMQYFLVSLEKLASTLDDVEKAQVEKLTLQFLNQHSYFLRIWTMLNDQQKRKVLYTLVSRKGVITYEKINSIDSLNNKPENRIFFSKDGFYGTLKGRIVGNNEYNNSNY